MRIWIANKFAKFRAKRLNRSENIPKSLGGYIFLNTLYTDMHSIAQQKARDATNGYIAQQSDVEQSARSQPSGLLIPGGRFPQILDLFHGLKIAVPMAV